MTAEADPGPPCLNCGAAVTGQYCGQCGQRSTTRLISLWELVRDAFGDLFELDSRLWRTMIPLLVRPGLLTRDYLQGRRARYMPPFRMYLVLSLLFFVIAFFDPHEQLAIFYEPAAESEAVDAEPDAARRQKARETLEALVAEGVLDESVLGADGPLAEPSSAADPAPGTADPPGFSFRVGDDDNECFSNDGDFESMRKDVALLRPNDSITLTIRNRDWLNEYPMHCHNTVHEDHAMLLLWEVVDHAVDCVEMP